MVPEAAEAWICSSESVRVTITKSDKVSTRVIVLLLRILEYTVGPPFQFKDTVLAKISNLVTCGFPQVLPVIERQCGNLSGGFTYRVYVWRRALAWPRTAHAGDGGKPCLVRAAHGTI